ncbi:MAG TPA: ATP-dependent DNA helicase RecG, partial [Dehalococcoidia bacterium]
KSAAEESSTAPRAPGKSAVRGPTLESPVTAIPGIGANRAELLAKLDVLTVHDLLYHFPHRHEDFSRVARVADLQVGETQTVVARVWSASLVSFGQSPRKSTELIVGDETGNLRVVFFNNPYPAASLRTNQRLTLSGKITVFHGQKQLENPEWEIVEQGGDLDQAIHTGRLVPVYPLTQGIQNRALRGYVRKALDLCADQLNDPLPAELRRRHGYEELAHAIRQAHYPDNAEALEAARRRLAYDELLTLQLAVVARKARRAASVRTAPLPFPAALRGRFVAGLPFPLTGAQSRAVDRILADLERETPMARLLQGDVGSGKTVVAAAALLAAAVNERQAVLMAPTEILAEQHFRTLCRLFGTDAVNGDALAEVHPQWLDHPLRLGLLRGGLRARAKRDVQEAIAAGEVEIAIGTQALLQQGVGFARLGLTVIDEQHRFGVLQRSALAEKGENTHLLVMTATPIPRTLALSLYGDLDVSVIDELPPGRKPVKTRVLEPHQREFAYRFIRDQIGQGFQAFVICPLVEESETLEVRAATDEYERLRSEVFPDLRVSLLHGRMTPSEKDAVMAGFRDREADVLVSTAVVEVGIDIPAATVILIEGAERFGLAQLHQFRGRVGRGGDQAYCLLLSDSPAHEARQRLKLLEQTRDGFRLAEEDLKLRGPGDYFGTRQSGLPALRQARLTDTPILEAAREDALALVARDPLLAAPELAALGARVAALAERAGDAN